jgi:hypothetical protein
LLEIHSFFDKRDNAKVSESAGSNPARAPALNKLG